MLEIDGDSSTVDVMMLLVRVIILRLAALQSCSVAVATASEGHRVKHKIAVISEQTRNGAGCLARARSLFHLK